MTMSESVSLVTVIGQSWRSQEETAALTRAVRVVNVYAAGTIWWIRLNYGRMTVWSGTGHVHVEPFLLVAKAVGISSNDAVYGCYSEC